MSTSRETPCVYIYKTRTHPEHQMPFPLMRVTALYLEMILGNFTNFMVIFSGFFVTIAKLHDTSDFYQEGNSYESQTHYYLQVSLQVSLVLFSRFFAVHFLIPFVTAVIVLIHVLFLHQTGSNNPLGLDKTQIKSHSTLTLQ